MEKENIEQQIEKLSKQIDDRQFPIKYNSEFIYICNLSAIELEALDAEKCGIYSFMLGQYSLYIQTQINKESAKMKWAKHNLDVIVGKLAKNYGGQYSKFEERKSMVLEDNQAAISLNKVLLNSTLIVEELSFLASKVNTLSQILLDLVNTKRRKEYVRV